MLRQVDLSLRSCGEGTCPWCTSRSCEVFFVDRLGGLNNTFFVLVGFWFIISPTMMMMLCWHLLFRINVDFCLAGKDVALVLFDKLNHQLSS